MLDEVLPSVPSGGQEVGLPTRVFFWFLGEMGTGLPLWGVGEWRAQTPRPGQQLEGGRGVLRLRRLCS